jgi:hypothetical protein
MEDDDERAAAPPPLNVKELRRLLAAFDDHPSLEAPLTDARILEMAVDFDLENLHDRDNILAFARALLEARNGDELNT